MSCLALCGGKERESEGLGIQKKWPQEISKKSDWATGGPLVPFRSLSGTCSLP